MNNGKIIHKTTEIFNFSFKKYFKTENKLSEQNMIYAKVFVKVPLYIL